MTTKPMSIVYVAVTSGNGEVSDGHASQHRDGAVGPRRPERREVTEEARPAFDEPEPLPIRGRLGSRWGSASAAARLHLAVDRNDDARDRQQRPSGYRPVEALVEEYHALERGDDGGHRKDGVCPEDPEVLHADEVQEAARGEVDDADHREPGKRAERDAEQRVRVQHRRDACDEHPTDNERHEVARSLRGCGRARRVPAACRCRSTWGPGARSVRR